MNDPLGMAIDMLEQSAGQSTAVTGNNQSNKTKSRRASVKVKAVPEARAAVKEEPKADIKV